MITTTQEALVALFETRSEAESAHGLLSAELPDTTSLEILTPHDRERAEAFGDVDASSIARDVAKGAAVGALGTAGAAAVAGVTILATGPVAAALVGAGVGAGAGAVGATAASATLHRPVLAGVLNGALDGGRHALVIGVDGESEALAAQDVLERSAAVKVVDRHGGQH